MSKMWQISVPGSTANLGPGFDSIGLGLSLYLKLTVSVQEYWEIIHLDDNGPKEFELEEHLLYVIAKKIADQFGKQLPACRVEMASELPLARGLGSSAAVIVAGIELANQVCELGLSVQDKLNLSSQIEGHPDNATASVLGGLTISSMNENGIVDTFHVNDIDAAFVVFVPDVELKTSESRSVLPEQFERTYAVHASANANMLAAALMARDFKRAGRYMEADLFHEPFRAKLIPNYTEIHKEAKANGAFGTALSGAGPTLISIVPTTIADDFVKAMKNKFPDHQIILTKADEHGIQVK
ncbi:homoserine kinase [Lysinibacillus pakistanensis]|uniref:Homoserine kinase n=1 Tax=Lysinibacillus pakistanensis TaxID=759811 RepID=A0AAX3WWU4_9BACI|nr:homoserine kinase [Lysinibacillus pakistanensis]MDM5230657.1 homoserine kinase [Lysinibacillus pakistanensis]QGG53398.1 homoserine kinase [Lysinibacillus pakistanensis]WHY46231.1 homoserine kinase [Lysinibacillus pakistanensis]WHY51243.1 homoserine kinase [Lysinibacillus pakistanensis]